MAGGVEHQQVVVSSKQQFDLAIQQFLAQGYSPHQMTQDMAFLGKPGYTKPLGIAFWISLFFFFPIAILIALSNRDTPGYSVMIRLETGATSVLPTPPPAGADMPRDLRMSEDGESWWNGAAWVAASEATPPMAKRSDDGTLWWDGEAWRAVR